MFIYLADVEYVGHPACSGDVLEWIENSKLLEVPMPETDWHFCRDVPQKRNLISNVGCNIELILTSIGEEVEETALVV